MTAPGALLFNQKHVSKMPRKTEPHASNGVERRRGRKEELCSSSQKSPYYFVVINFTVRGLVQGIKDYTSSSRSRILA